MNSHLLLYNFYSSGEEQFIENNLSRALAISLNNEHILLNHFLREVLTEQQYNDLFFSIEEQFPIEIDIQKKMVDIEETGQLIAVALSPLDLTKSINKKPVALQTENPITDLYIRIKDLCIIIEVKINEEDSIPQLLGQVQSMIDSSKVEEKNVAIKSITWSRLIELFLSSQLYLSSTQNSSVFINDFIRHVEQRFPAWFPVKTLNYLPFTTDDGNPTFAHIYRRLEIIKSQVMYEKEEPLKIFKNRTSIPLDFNWASEVNIGIQINPFNKEQSLFIDMAPGDTKAQGNWLFSKNLKWANNNNLKIADDIYPMLIYPYLKLSHWTKGVSWLSLIDDWDQYRSKVVTREKFEELSGRWAREKWPEFVNDMDSMFPPEWRDRERANWQESFINSNRQYFDLAFGFSVSVYIPYSKAQELEKNIDATNTLPLSELIRKVIEEISLMIEG